MPQSAADKAESAKADKEDASADPDRDFDGRANIREAFHRTHAYNCLECGKCTSICPVAVVDPGFSPRLLVKAAILEFEDDLVEKRSLWECLTCDLCGARCHSDVNLPEFIRSLRKECLKVGNTFLCSHNNVFQLISKLQIQTGEHQKRLEWVPADVKYHEEGDTLFFVGCAPYHHIIFEERNQDNLALPIASLKLLNHIGIEPVLLPNERCCGHDQYWSGHQETFEKLMNLNIEAFKNAGVKKIISACPEGHYMFSNIYPELADEFPFECVHITEILAEQLKHKKMKLPNMNSKTASKIVSYHDSCKLGRYMEVYDAPRQIINQLPGVEFRELEKNKSSSSCCGVSGFINCDMNSKIWRQAKLQEAANTGADTLLTGCPKCAIHLNCYLESEHVEPKFEIKVEPVIITLARAMNLLPQQNNDNNI